MKRWALVVAGLYLLILVVLTLPVAVLSFPKMIHDSKLTEMLGVYAWAPYWLWAGVMALGQMALLAVPVKITSRRPVTRRSLLTPILAAGLMLGGLALGAVYSLGEFALYPKHQDWGGPLMWGGIGFGLLTWVVWTVLFYRLSRTSDPSELISRQCRSLLKGSILELLVAVPTHLVARSRDYCCAGFMTFIGITLGLSVMLFSFGPGVFFLFVDRWKRLHPKAGGAGMEG